MDPVPLECKLELPELRTQRDRYRRVAGSVKGIERTETRLAAVLEPEIDRGLVDELVAVERDCCPFFTIDWDRDARRLAFAVRPEHGLALDAIAEALSPQ